MKIIGTSNDKWPRGQEYILTATGEELANLMGYYYKGEKEVVEKLNQAGADIPIHQMFEKLYDMANQEKSLMEISAKLKAAADFVDTALPGIRIINKTKEEVK